MEATVNSNLSFLVAEIFVFLNYSKIVLLRQENIRIMLAVLLLEKGQKLCSIPQIMPKIMLAQSARAYHTDPDRTSAHSRMHNICHTDEKTKFVTQTRKLNLTHRREN